MTDKISSRTLGDRCITIIHHIEDSILVLMLAAMILLATSQIVMRNLFDAGFIWADPLLRVMVLWLGMLGAMIASRSGKHISIDAVSAFIPQRMFDAIRVVTCLFTVSICSIIAWFAGQFVMMEFEEQSIVLSNIPAWYLESIIPFSFAVIALRYLILAVFYARSFLTGRKT